MGRHRRVSVVLGAVVAAIGIALTSVPGPARAATPVRVRDDRLGANAPYAFRTVDLRLPVADPDLFGNVVTLDARVLIPEGAGPFPGLLVNHGYLGDKTGDGGTAEDAARSGYIVLRYSSRGFGQTLGQVDLVGDEEIHDMVTAVRWLNDPAHDAEHGPVWSGHIGHYGGSYGGAHAWQLALQGLPEVKAIVAAATWTDLYEGLLPSDTLKIAYENGFYAAGRLRTDGYDNYDPEIDVLEARANSGVDLDGAHADLRHPRCEGPLRPGAHAHVPRAGSQRRPVRGQLGRRGVPGARRPGHPRAPATSVGSDTRRPSRATVPRSTASAA